MSGRSRRDFVSVPSSLSVQDFNEYFLSVANETTSDIPLFDKCLSEYLKASPDVCIPFRVTFDEVKEEDVLSYIQKLEIYPFHPNL